MAVQGWLLINVKGSRPTDVVVQSRNFLVMNTADRAGEAAITHWAHGDPLPCP